MGLSGRQSPRAGGNAALRQRMRVERRRLTFAYLFSLLFHALLLSLTFGGQGFGLPGLDFPWRERRIAVPDLRVVLMPAQATAAAPAVTVGPPLKTLLRQALIGQPVARGPALAASVSSAPTTPGRTAEAIVPKDMRTAEVRLTDATRPVAEPQPGAGARLADETKSAAEAGPEPDTATVAAPEKAPLRTERSADVAPTAIPEPEVIAMAPTDEAAFVVPVAPSLPTPVIAAAPGALSPEHVMLAPQDTGDAALGRSEPEAQEKAVELATLGHSAQVLERQVAQLEAARQAAALEAAARAEAARLEAERVGARLEADRQKAARQAAALKEAARVEAARLEAERVAKARLEAERQEAARQAAALKEAAWGEAARLDAGRAENARLEAERQEAARILEEQEEDARRYARRRAMGRQLDEEAARREAASNAVRSPSTLPYSLSTARRVRLWGRSDPNAELVQYAEAWARKIQFNTSVDTVREVTKRPHINPMVTVAIRSDGSVESVSFVLSSGVAEVDEAIRRIVQSHVPYQAFPPGLARAYDVVEIRRTWKFDMAIWLY